MEIEKLTKEIRNRAFEKKKDKTPEQVAASWYNDDLTYNGVSKTLQLHMDDFHHYYGQSMRIIFSQNSSVPYLAMLRKICYHILIEAKTTFIILYFFVYVNSILRFLHVLRRSYSYFTRNG